MLLHMHTVLLLIKGIHRASFSASVFVEVNASRHSHTPFIQPLSQGKGINQIIPDYCEPVGSNLLPGASLNSNTNWPPDEYVSRLH